jgi:hypothetical protein
MSTATVETPQETPQEELKRLNKIAYGRESTASYEEQTAARQRISQLYDEARRDAQELLEASRDNIITPFVTQMKAFFDGFGQKTYTRRPNIKLRLTVRYAQEQAKVIVTPSWSPGHHITSDAVRIGLYYAELKKNSKGDVKTTWDDKFGFEVRSDRIQTNPIMINAKYHAVITLATLADFITDASAVLARSQDHCACCGKPLTDPLSQGRGFGPECVRQLVHAEFRMGDQSRILLPSHKG